MAAIETIGLTKYYGVARGVEAVDLRVDEGEVFGFLGPNGAGKTTTIRLLLGLIRATRGEIRLFGQPAGAGSVALRRSTGYLPGELGLYPHLTGRQWLHRFASLRGGQVGPRAEELARRLDLDLGRGIKGMSHGTIQKLAIVQAFMHEARLLVLDEPTSGLDPLAQQVFYEFVREERDRNRTVFLSSHVLSEVEKTCSRVAMIRDGRIVVVEGIDDLKRKRVKWAEVEFRQPVDAETFRMPGVRSIEAEGRRVRIEIEGNYAPVLEALARHPIDNVSINDASLDDIFLEYYARHGEETP